MYSPWFVSRLVGEGRLGMEGESEERGRQAQGTPARSLPSAGAQTRRPRRPLCFRHSGRPFARVPSGWSGMHSAYQETDNQGPKPEVSVFWCAECTPEPFRACSERECTLWLVRETAVFVLAHEHKLKTTVKYICTDSGRLEECIYGVYFKF